MELLDNKKKLCLDGFIYTQHSNSGSSVHWRCSKRSSRHCPCRLRTNIDYTNPMVDVTTHTHPGNATEVAILKARLQMKENANRGNPSQVYANAVGGLDAHARASLTLEDSCKRTIRNARNRQLPPDPVNINALVIANEWTQTTLGNRFLLYDNYDRNNNRIIIFATDEHIQLLSQARKWYMDGCFKLAPAGLFMQIYIICIEFGNRSIPVVYALLERKLRATYEEMLRAINNYMFQINVIPAVRAFSMDFEIGAHNAAFAVFPNRDIDGCFYHLTQSTWRKIQELGLAVRYSNDPLFKNFCGMLDALAFLRLVDVPVGMNIIRNIAIANREPAPVMNLIDYFDSTYVSGNGNQPPMFPPAKWNVHALALYNDPKTNNICEGQNSRLKTMCDNNRPHVWKLLNVLKHEEARASTKIAQYAAGNREPARVTLASQQMQTRIRNQILSYLGGRLAPGVFLANVAHNIRF